MQRVYEKGIMQISMIDMASVASVECGRRPDMLQDKWTNKKVDKKRRQASKQERRQTNKMPTKGGVHDGQK